MFVFSFSFYCLSDFDFQCQHHLAHREIEVSLANKVLCIILFFMFQKGFVASFQSACEYLRKPHENGCCFFLPQKKGFQIFICYAKSRRLRKRRAIIYRTRSWGAVIYLLFKDVAFYKTQYNISILPCQCLVAGIIA